MDLDYTDYIHFLTKTYHRHNEYIRYPCVCPGWYSTARKGENAFMFKNSTPSMFKTWLNFHVENTKVVAENEQLIFINAWNEWAEGNHLEPCQKWGLAYLEAVENVCNQ